MGAATEQAWRTDLTDGGAIFEALGPAGDNGPPPDSTRVTGADLPDSRYRNPDLCALECGR